ncbi:MAG: PspC domain-containing protein [Bacteroidales bacterium]|nr:PspC domain-containing protein [Bacteroidales bacterium]
METPTYKRLTRDIQNKSIAGVCSGLGRYFNIDPVLFRLIFIAAIITGGWGLLLYIIMWIVIPADNLLPR